MTDHYGILGVPRDATPEQLKKAHRRRSKELHPDRVGGDSGPMAAVNRAYDILSDPVKRAVYDAGGDEALLSQNAVEHAASMRLKETFNNALAQMVNNGMVIPNLLEQVVRMVGEIAMREEDMIDNAKESLKRLQKEKGRLRHKNGKDSIYDIIVDEQIIKCTEAIAQGKKSLEVTRTALAMLSELEETGGSSQFFKTFSLLGG